MSTPAGYARRSDVISSHITGASIAGDLTLQDRILVAGITFWQACHRGDRSKPTFTDTELTEEIERVTGKRQQRNVIARARQLMMDTERHPVKDPMIEEVGLFKVDGRLLLHFRIVASVQAQSRQTTERTACSPQQQSLI